MSRPERANIDLLLVGDFVNYYHREHAYNTPGTLCVVLKTETDSGTILMNFFLGGVLKAFEEEVFELSHMQREMVKAWTLATMKSIEHIGPFMKDVRE